MSTTYTRTAIRLHWVIAILILTMLAGGFLMGYIPKENTSLRVLVFNWHKTIGLLILVLSLFRLFWRLGNKPPAAPSDLKSWEKQVTKLTHFLFYTFMIVMPLVGWAIISTSRFPSKLFNALHLPKLPILSAYTGDERAHVHGFFEETHKIIAFIAIALIVLHVLAALKHHRAGQDVLVRMMPGLVIKRNS